MADIKTRFTLEGEQAFRKAMSDAATETKRLNAEQKLAKAQFKATGDEEKYAAEQTRILKEKITEQEKAVKAAQDALNQMTAQGVEKNSKAWQQWQGKLIAAQTALANTQAEMNSLDGTANKATSSANKTATAVESIGKKVSFDATIQGIHGITSAAEAAFRKVTQLAKSLWNMEADASVWADDLITQAAQYGMDTTTLQQMQYASQIVDADVNDIVKAMDRINKERNKAGGALDIGGTLVDMTGLTEMEAFWEAIDAMRNLPTDAERDAAAMTLMGKSFRELNTLMADDAQERWTQAMEDAPTLEEEQVGKLGELNDALVTLQAEWDTTKRQLQAELAPVFTELAQALTDLVEQISVFSQSEQGQKAIEDFGNALKWIADNSGSVVAGLTAIGGALAALKVSEGVLKFLEMKDGFESLMGRAGRAAGNAAGGTSAAASGGGLLSLAKNALPIAAAAAIVAETVALSKKALGVEKRNYQIEMFGNATELTGWNQQQRAYAEAYYDNYRAEVLGIDPEAAGRSVQAYNALVESFGGVEDEALKFDQILENLNFDEALPEDLPDELFQSMQDAADAAVKGLTSRMDVFYAAGQAMASRFSAGISAGYGPRNQSITSNLYVGTMNMTNGNAKNLVGMIGNALARDRAAYGSP